jgi:hypothetical protein
MVVSEKVCIDTLRQMNAGFARTQELYTTVKLGIADHLAKGPRQAYDLAMELKVHPRALYRFLRLLVARKILCEDGDKGFQLTPLGDLLRSDHPNTLRNIILYNGEVSYRVGQEMLYSVQTGKPAFEKFFGMPFYDYLQKHPDICNLFNSMMNYQTTDRFEGLANNYNFSQVSTIVDIGGGNGAQISYILKNNPKAKGIIYDLPAVASVAIQNLAKNNLTDRCQVISGDFFEDTIPKGKDIYILSNIIHNWDDERAILILNNCHNVMSNNSKLLLIEQIMPEKITDDTAVAGTDVGMLLLTGGTERTLQEYKTLLAQVGLEIIHNFGAGGKSNFTIMECG